MVLFRSTNFVLIAAVTLFLSCASSPRYSRKTQVIPQQKTEPVREIKTTISPQRESETIAQEMVVPNDIRTNDSTETTVSSGNDTIYTFYQQGLATYYADKLNGHKTAFGERYDRKLYTAAHRTLPHNSFVRVTAISTKKSVIVRINDRGPFSKNRVIDLSKAAATEIDLVAHGIMNVSIETIEVK